MTGWHEQCGILGGFMWIYDDFVGTGLAAQYASASTTRRQQRPLRFRDPRTFS